MRCGSVENNRVMFAPCCGKAPTSLAWRAHVVNRHWSVWGAFQAPDLAIRRIADSWRKVGAAECAGGQIDDAAHSGITAATRSTRIQPAASPGHPP